MNLLILAAVAAMSSSDGSAATSRALNLAVMKVAPEVQSHEATLTLRSIGLAKTSVEKELTKGATGSLGFLCGRQAGQTDQGGASAFGYDPNGRFVGAKLSIGF